MQSYNLFLTECEVWYSKVADKDLQYNCKVLEGQKFA